MTEETEIQEPREGPRKRKVGPKRGNKSKKKMRPFKGTGEKVKIDSRMKKLFHKRARDYNSDDDDEEEPAPVNRYKKERARDKRDVHEEDVLDEKSSDEEREDHEGAGEENEFSDDEAGEIQPGVTKFIEGCKAFKMAFKKITKKNVSDDVLGPVLSAHKKLVAEKLAEEEEERKVKGDSKKEKQLVAEEGHVKPPANFLDSHEKFLIGVATKGVVKLFNAVNKAQHAQKGLNPSRSKDAKVLKRRRKEAFFSEMGKTASEFGQASSKVSSSTGVMDSEGPAWAPLRDNYMLTNPKLKDWDKMPETTAAADDLGMPTDSSSEDD